MTTAAAAPPNGSNVNGASPTNTIPPGAAGARTQLKMNSSGKGADGARKLGGSPVDAGTRKPPPQKAWTQGTNPITQRSSNVNSPNGFASGPKAPQGTPAASESPSAMQHLSERMLFLLAQMTGLPSNITLKNGERYTGVFSTATVVPNDSKYLFKMVKRIAPAGAQVNGADNHWDDYIGHGDDHVMAFDVADVADLNIPNVVLDKTRAKSQNGVASGFRTDTDISGNAVIREKDLQRWEPSDDIDMNHSLESTGRSTEWDQFSTNKQLFGVTSNYDENFYTTKIDRSDPQYAEKAARAEKIAREIEAETAMNAHVREERGYAPLDDRGADEEDKYSGVRRDFPPLPSGAPNKYTPPARRPPTGQPTVPGAPVDPSIISSSLARPDSASAKAAPNTPKPPEKTSTPEPPKAEAVPMPADAKDTATKAEMGAMPPTKPAPEQAPKPTTGLKPVVAGVSARKPGRGDNADNATANVEHALLDSFKQFANSEKMRLSERQRAVARESKAVKLNDLKKFSQNFKLNTPVPTDLVPILAKDETKQQQIVEKALRAVQEKKTPSAQSTPGSVEPKTAPRATPIKPETSHVPPSPATDRQQNQRPRPGQGHYGAATMRDRAGPNQNANQGPRGTGLLSSRLAISHQQHKQQGPAPYNNIPHPIPTQDTKMQDLRALAPSGPSAPSSGVQTPTSMRFNVRANEFKPNPAANTFQPGGNPSANSSPRPASASRQDSPRKPQQSSFFGGHRPTVAPLDLSVSFNPIKWLMNEAHDDSNKSREYANNGGVPFPFRTPPTWDFPETNKERGYIAIIENNAVTPPISAPHNIMVNGPIPHQHQLPPHLQGPQPQGPTPQHTPRHPPVQPHHSQGGPPHFEGHNMQFSHSTSSVHPSPRTMPPFMYGSQPQGMQGFPQQAPMQPYGMSPVVQHAGLRQPGGHQFIPPVPGMGGQMMTNQPSNGPFMGIPGNHQMPMYSAGQGPAYSHYPNQMPGPGPTQFPSPRPGAPMMHHQGSQQGHQPPHIVYMPQGGPMYAQMPPGSMTPMRQQAYPQAHPPGHYGSPQQHHQFPQQHRGTSSGSYSQPMMQQHSLPPQGPLPTGPANHGQDGKEEVK